MTPTKTIQFLLLISLFQFSFQQSSNFLPNIIQNVDEATVGYGNQAVDITHQGGSTLDNSTFHFEATELENLASDEWTVQWTDTEGEDYHLIDENGHIIQVGPNNSTEDVTDELANAAGIPDSSVAGVIGTLAKDLVQKVDEKGGNVTLTGNEVYSEAVGPVTIAVLNAKFSSSSIGSGLENAGNTVSNAASTVGSAVSNGASDVKNTAEDVGETMSNAASNAWNDTKNAASDVGNSIANAATDFGENVSEGAQDAWNATKDATNTVADKASDVGNDIANAATDFGENVSDAAQNAWNDTKNAADTVAENTKDVVDQVGNAVTNAVDGLKDGISSLFGN